MRARIAILGGDGIGPELARQKVKAVGTEAAGAAVVQALKRLAS